MQPEAQAVYTSPASDRVVAMLISAVRRLISSSNPHFRRLETCELLDAASCAVMHLHHHVHSAAHLVDDHPCGAVSRQLDAPFLRRTAATGAVVGAHPGRLLARELHHQATLLDIQNGEAPIAAGMQQEQEANDEGTAADDSALRQQILEGALSHVRTLGWSTAALQAAAKELGYSPAVAGLVEGGETELVQYFMDKCNAELAQRLADMAPELQQMRVPERIFQGAKLRLEMIIPFIDVWPQALALQSHPAAAPKALQQVATLVDDIWHAAGDKSTDHNWYTKRALLGGVYCSTQLYMLTDASPGFADTWAALRRRLAEVAQVGSSLGSVITALSDNLARVLQKPPANK